MKSATLLETLNEVQRPFELLTKLSEANFGVTDFTEEGDSILHVLAKSKHANKYNFSSFLDTLMSAGANPNSVDKQANSFLSYYLETRSYYSGDTLAVLLRSNDFDVHQRMRNGGTLFEYIHNATSYNLKDLYPTLLKHPKFDPNQKTSTHNSILLHMICDRILRNSYELDDIITNIKTNPNIKNNEGQTALAYHLSNASYKELRLISQLIDHPQTDLNTLDNEGNNYLQLAVMHCQTHADDIAKLFIEKGIDVSHKNNEGKSVFDLILENKAKRSDYANNIVLLEILKKHPSSLLASYSNNKTILGEILKSKEYTLQLQAKTLLQLCKNQPNSAKFIKKIISEGFEDFEKNNMPIEAMRTLINIIIEEKLDIVVEYYLAKLAISPESFRKTELIDSIEKLKPDFDSNTVLHHIRNLTNEQSEERLQGINSLFKSRVPLQCFDTEILAWEEQLLRDKRNSDLKKDSKMFAHLFSLNGSIPVNNGLSTLTGAIEADTAPFMVHLMNAYVTHCERSGTYNEQLDAIKEVRNMTVKAMRYYFLSRPDLDYSPKVDNFALSMLAESKRSGVEILTGWDGHTVDLIIKQEDLYRNNGGGCSTDATTEIYAITKPQNLTEAVIKKLYQNSGNESNKSYIQQELHKILGLVFTQSSGENFQTVGNCSLYSQIIALKVKYRLFLPKEMADAIYADTIKFFEQFFLEEYLSRYSKSAILPHLLMRLIKQKLLVENNLELTTKLIKEHFNSEDKQEILRTEFMLKRWLLVAKGKTTEEFDKQLDALHVVLNPNLNQRLQILDHFLNDKVTLDDLNEIKTWPLEQQTFQGYHLLHIAVLNDNLTLASSLLQLVPKAVNLSNWYEEDPLCLVKSVAMIDLLVNAGASTKKTHYDNALDKAIKANRADLVLALLEHGAQPSEYSAYYAASRDPKILQAVMKFHPATITKPTHNYRSAIHAAASSGRSENLRNLVYYGGANPAATDVNGISPIQLALQQGHNDTAKLLLEYPGTLFKKPHRGDRIVTMTRDDDLKQTIKDKKKEKKMDLSYFERFKMSKPGIVEENIDYLIIAIRKNDLRAIRGCLLEFPNINVVNSSKLYCTTPLTQAIQNLARRKGRDYDERFEIVQMLLKTAAIDINALMLSTEPILFMATSINDVKVLELFLADPQLDLNKQDNMGYTALHDAVERGHLECVKRLLQDDRIDSTIQNYKNETAADLKGFGRDIRKCCEEVTKHQLCMQQTRVARIS